MRIGLVKGAIVSTKKNDALVGASLLIVQPVNERRDEIGVTEIAVDVLGAGAGEYVLLCTGSSAKAMFDNPKAPIDLVVVGIIDSL